MGPASFFSKFASLVDFDRFQDFCRKLIGDI